MNGLALVDSVALGIARRMLGLPTRHTGTFTVRARRPTQPPPAFSDRQRAIVASAVRAAHLDELRADLDHHRAGLRDALGDYVDELAAGVDPRLIRRRQAREQAAALHRRVHGATA